MPEVEEVFRMATQKVRPDPGAIERQNRAQRRRNNRRKAGVYVLVACLTLGVVAFALEVLRDENTTTPPAVEPSSGQTLSIVDLGSGSAVDFAAPLDASRLDFTLDGSMVAYTALDEHGNEQVFVMNADGSNARQLTHGTQGFAHAGFPLQWSPDGSRIAYWVELPESGVELFVVRIDDGASTRITREPTDVYEGGWASDRSFVFSISNARTQYPLLARSIDLQTGETQTIARDVNEPQVSPDGTRIAFDAYFRPSGEAWLSMMNIDGTSRRKIRRVTYSGSYPKWSPDGTQIAYTDDTVDGGVGTYVYDLASGTARFVTSGTIESWVDDHHVLVS